MLLQRNVYFFPHEKKDTNREARYLIVDKKSINCRRFLTKVRFRLNRCERK